MVRTVPFWVCEREGEKMIARRKSILWFALWGAVGFGIGGAIGSITPWPVGFVVPGAVGGASLGLALKGWKRAGLLALAGAVGYVAGLMAAFSIAFTFSDMGGEWWQFILGAIIGAVIGVSLGLALRNWVGAGLLALAGAIGFGIGYAAHLTWYDVIGRTAWGLIGGAFLGAALGYLQGKRPID